MMFCIFKRKTAYEMRISDWSSDVCSSDLVASLGFDDRQCGERAGLALDRAVGELLDVFLVDTRSALEQTRMQVEHVAGVGLATRRATQQQRYLAIRHRPLGHTVVHHQCVTAAVAKVFANGAARLRRNRTSPR